MATRESAQAAPHAGRALHADHLPLRQPAGRHRPGRAASSRSSPTCSRHGLETLEACACRPGCPSCVGPVNEVGRRAKPTALALLRRADRLRRDAEPRRASPGHPPHRRRARPPAAGRRARWSRSSTASCVDTGAGHDPRRAPRLPARSPPWRRAARRCHRGAARDARARGADRRELRRRRAAALPRHRDHRAGRRHRHVRVPGGRGAGSTATPSRCAQYFMRDFDEEPALLAALEPLFGALRRASSRTTAPASTCRCSRRASCSAAAAGRPTLPNLDLLDAGAPACGRRWLADCRLATLESEVLGFARDDDVPGALIPLLYFDYLRRERPGRSRACSSTTATTSSRSPRSSAGSARALASGRRRASGGAGRSRPPAGSRSTSSARSRATGSRSAAGLREPVARWARLRLALWEKRAARWEAACALWEAARAATTSSIRGRGRRWPSSTSIARAISSAARAIVADALDQARSIGAAPRVLDGFAYRLARIERRLNRPGLDPATT